MSVAVWTQMGEDLLAFLFAVLLCGHFTARYTFQNKYIRSKADHAAQLNPLYDIGFNPSFDISIHSETIQMRKRWIYFIQMRTRLLLTVFIYWNIASRQPDDSNLLHLITCVFLYWLWLPCCIWYKRCGRTTLASQCGSFSVSFLNIDIIKLKWNDY